MSREWKPGDVARIELGNGVIHDIALRLPLHEGGWATGRSKYVHSVHVTNARPLVVIDPEDREQVERLALTLRDHKGWCGGVVREATDAMQAALRSLIAPPRPQFKPGDVAQLGLGKGGRIPVTAFRATGGYWIDTDGVTIEDGVAWWVNPIFVAEDDPTEGVTE